MTAQPAAANRPRIPTPEEIAERAERRAERDRRERNQLAALIGGALTAVVVLFVAGWAAQAVWGAAALAAAAFLVLSAAGVAALIRSINQTTPSKEQN